MKVFGVLLVASLVMMESGFAHAVSNDNFEALLNASSCSFTAPTVADHTNSTVTAVSNVGDIVYDGTLGQYYGRTVSGWAQLSPPSGSNSVISAGTSERVERALLSLTNGACAITSQSGFLNSSCSNSPTGTYSLTINAGVFSSAPSCVVAGTNNTALIRVQTGTSGITILTANLDSPFALANLNDTGVSLICMGPK